MLLDAQVRDPKVPGASRSAKREACSRPPEDSPAFEERRDTFEFLEGKNGEEAAKIH